MIPYSIIHCQGFLFSYSWERNCCCDKRSIRIDTIQGQSQIIQAKTHVQIHNWEAQYNSNKNVFIVFIKIKGVSVL